MMQILETLLILFERKISVLSRNDNGSGWGGFLDAGFDPRVFPCYSDLARLINESFF